MSKRQRHLKPDPMRPNPRDGESQSSASGMMPDASIAASESAQGATGDGVTVMPLAHRQLTDNDNGNIPKPNAAGGVDLTSTKPNATLTQCDYCGREFVARRKWTRFCNAYCRRRAWLENNAAKAVELAAKDKQRLRARVIERGGQWREDTRVER